MMEEKEVLLILIDDLIIDLKFINLIMTRKKYAQGEIGLRLT
jgi:hypothetical protein